MNSTDGILDILRSEGKHAEGQNIQPSFVKFSNIKFRGGHNLLARGLHESLFIRSSGNAAFRNSFVDSIEGQQDAVLAFRSSRS